MRGTIATEPKRLKPLLPMPENMMRQARSISPDVSMAGNHSGLVTSAVVANGGGHRNCVVLHATSKSESVQVSLNAAPAA